MIKKICSVLSTCLLVVLALVAAVLIVPKFLGYTQYAVLSGSMEPKIKVGSIVYTKTTDIADLETGDIITYKLAGDTMVTHRIVSVNDAEQTVITKGDANETEDAAPVAFDSIQGAYVFHVPLLGYISIYGKTPLGIAGICGVLVVVILLNFLPDAFSNEEDEVQKAEQN